VDEAMDAGRSRRLVFGLLIAATCVVSLVAFTYRWTRFGIFWDISVYTRAVADYGHGVDPYRTTNEVFPFMYHPLVLRLLALLAGLIHLRVLLPALTLAALVWLFHEILRAGVVSSTIRLLATTIVACAFGGLGVPAILSGNVAPLMHLSLMAALLHSVRVHGSLAKLVPYALILVFALVKPYFLIFLAAPVLLRADRWVALASAAAVAVLFAVVWIGSAVYIWPDEYAHFLHNLQWHILGKADLGYTFFFVFSAITPNVPLALGLHVLVAVLLIALVWLLFAKRYDAESPAAPRLLLLYLVLTLANPRMKDYDLFPALVGFFAVFELLSPRAAPVTLAALALANVPLLSPFFPGLSAAHPMLFDPYGTWQIVGLAAIGLLTLAGMLDAESADGKHGPASKPL
jgi:hypothetical protein